MPMAALFFSFSVVTRAVLPFGCALFFTQTVSGCLE